MKSWFRPPPRLLALVELAVFVPDGTRGDDMRFASGAVAVGARYALAIGPLQADPYGHPVVTTQTFSDCAVETASAHSPELALRGIFIERQGCRDR